MASVSSVLSQHDLALAAAAALSLGQIERAHQLALSLDVDLIKSGLRGFLLGSVEARRGLYEAALETAVDLYGREESRAFGERLRRETLGLMQALTFTDIGSPLELSQQTAPLYLNPHEPLRHAQAPSPLGADATWLDLFRHWSHAIGSGRIAEIGHLGEARLEQLIGVGGDQALGLQAAQVSMGYDEANSFSFCYYLMGMRGVEALPAPLGVIGPNDDRRPQVSIILPVFNKWILTLNCLRSLLAARHGSSDELVSFEVILADDASSDETNLIPERCPWLQHARLAENRGFVENCNHAAARARGDVLVFLNNDTLVGDDWLGALLGTLRRRPTAGIVGSQVYSNDGRLLESGGILWGNGEVWNHGRGFGEERWFELDHEREVDYVSGCAMAIRRELWNELGGFDLLYRPAYCEDADFCMRAREQAGQGVMVQPQSRILHMEGLSNARSTEAGLKRYQVINLDKLRQRWRRQLLTQQPLDMSLQLLASDRGLRRGPVALVVDHYFPTPDRDAGSRCTLAIVSSLLALGFKVVFLPDNFAPMDGYRQRLEEWGVLCLWGNQVSASWPQWLAKQVERVDVILYNRPHITSRFLPVLEKIYPDAFRLYNTHDLHGLREALEHRQPKQLHRELQPPGNEQAPFETLCTEQERGILNRVDAVLSISAKESDLLQPHVQVPVHTLPGYILPWNGEGASRVEASRAVLLVGGFGHRPNQLAVEWLLEHVWPLLADRAELVVVGSNCPPELREKLEMAAGVRFEGEVSDQRLAELYEAMRVSLAPLPYGAGLKGKVIEALSWGHRVVGSGYAFEGLVEPPPQAVRCCHQPEAFVQAIEEALSLEGEEVAELEQACRRFIESHFSAGAQQATLGRILAERLRPAPRPVALKAWPEGLQGSARGTLGLLACSSGLCVDGWLETTNQLVLQPLEEGAGGGRAALELGGLELGLYLPEDAVLQGEPAVELELSDGQITVWSTRLALQPGLTLCRLPWPAELGELLTLTMKGFYRYKPPGSDDQRQLLAVLAQLELLPTIND